MGDKEFSGNYLNAFLSDVIYQEDEVSKKLEKTVPVSSDEAVCIYSFKEQKILFIKGYDRLFDFNLTSVSIKDITSVWDENITDFFKEFFDRVLLYAYNNNNDLKSIECKSIFKSRRVNSVVKHSVKAFGTDENGNLQSVIVRIKRDNSLKAKDIIQYSLSGAGHEKSFKDMKYNLNYKKCISKREIEMIESFVDRKKSNSILSKVLLNPEEFIIVLENLIERFELENRNELIQFAEENYLIPCQL